jgi:hypothetical protein
MVEWILLMSPSLQHIQAEYIYCNISINILRLMLPRAVGGGRTTIVRISRTVAPIIEVGTQINAADNVAEVEEAAGTVE